MRKRIFRIMRDNRAATAIEYGMILALIAVAGAGAIQAFANGTVGMWNNVSTNALTHM